MDSYGINLKYSEGQYDFQDAIILDIATDEAKALNINKKDIIVRVGVKFTYGVRALSVGLENPDGYGHTPTIHEPWKVSGYTYVLGVDLDSICLLKQKNYEVISCRL